MTFWLDAHLDPDLGPWLGSRYKVIVKTLPEIGLEGADDDVLFQAARRFSKIVIITKDSDFSDFIKRFGSPPQILWLRCGNLSTIEIIAWLSGTFSGALERLEAGVACVEIPRVSSP